jgi:hypothetical protein
MVQHLFQQPFTKCSDRDTPLTVKLGPVFVLLSSWRSPRGLRSSIKCNFLASHDFCSCLSIGSLVTISRGIRHVIWVGHE